MEDSLLIGLLGALVGVFIGHRLTISMYRARSKALENAFYAEFQIIRDDFKSWFPDLVDEYESPLRNKYTGPAPLDLRLVESIVVELAGTDKIIAPEQRMLLSRLERIIGNIRRNNSNRDIGIKKWIEKSESMDRLEERNIKNEIQFITAQLLIDVSQGLYFLEKLLNDRRKFTIGNISSVNIFLERAFEICSLEFNSDKWSAVTKRLGFNQ